APQAEPLPRRRAGRQLRCGVQGRASADGRAMVTVHSQALSCSSFSSARLYVPAMGIATRSAATPRAYPNSLKMFTDPILFCRLCLSGNKARTIPQPTLHFFIKRVVVYF